MPVFYLTFGVNTERKGRYQIIYAPDKQAARNLAFDQHGNHWAFCYDEDEFIGDGEEWPDQRQRYGLVPLPMILGVTT